MGRAAGGLTALLNQTRGRNYSDLAVSFEQDGKIVEAVFDPKAVSVIPDIESNSLVVMAPSKAMPFMDHFIAMAQNETGGNQSTLKLFEIKHAKASELQRTLASIFRVRYSNSRRNGSAVTTEPAFAVDARSNTLLVTAASSELTEIENLVKKLCIKN